MPIKLFLSSITYSPVIYLGVIGLCLYLIAYDQSAYKAGLNKSRFTNKVKFSLFTIGAILILFYLQFMLAFHFEYEDMNQVQVVIKITHSTYSKEVISYEITDPDLKADFLEMIGHYDLKLRGFSSGGYVTVYPEVMIDIYNSGDNEWQHLFMYMDSEELRGAYYRNDSGSTYVSISNDTKALYDWILDYDYLEGSQ